MTSTVDEVHELQEELEEGCAFAELHQISFCGSEDDLDGDDLLTSSSAATGILNLSELGTDVSDSSSVVRNDSQSRVPCESHHER